MATHFAWFSDVTANAAPEEEDLGNGVGTIEGRDTDRKNDVEGCGRAKIDDTNETRDAGYNVNRVVRDRRLGMHLVTGELEDREKSSEAFLTTT